MTQVFHNHVSTLDSAFTDPVVSLRRPANPSYTADELKHQLSLTSAKLIIAHPACLAVAKAAARSVGLSDDRIVLFNTAPSAKQHAHSTLDQLIELGSSRGENYKAITFKQGEARTTVAFLSFSSGTTGKPKVRVFPRV